MTRPDQYTTEDTGYPVGIYMPGVYFTVAYIRYIEDRDREAATETSTAIADIRNRPAGDKPCIICARGFKPMHSNQITCSPGCNHQRKLQTTRENDKKRYQAKPLAPRKCEICGDSYQPLKAPSKTCGKPCAEALRQKTRRASYLMRKERAA